MRYRDYIFIIACFASCAFQSSAAADEHQKREISVLELHRKMDDEADRLIAMRNKAMDDSVSRFRQAKASKIEKPQFFFTRRT